MSKLIAKQKTGPQKVEAENVLYLVEHDPPVYTMGRRETYADLLIDQKRLKEMGAELIKTTRGGAGTCA